jgi:hypothetical protein
METLDEYPLIQNLRRWVPVLDWHAEEIDHHHVAIKYRAGPATVAVKVAKEVALNTCTSLAWVIASCMGAKPPMEMPQ